MLQQLGRATIERVVMDLSIVMNGGDGPNNYTHNSTIQAEVVDRGKVLLRSTLQQNLTISIDNSKVFTIADLGCSVGPNTYTCASIVIEAVKNAYKTTLGDDQIPEFQVFFSDNVANDFNTLFQNLPSNREYMAAGVPGSFHGRLFPKASINLMHSSTALHWLSKVPEQITERDSPAWNKGSITYVQSSPQVKEAYIAQFMEDMKCFFSARSVEMANDGLLAITIPYQPDGAESKALHGMEYCLGQALADMSKEGMLSEALVDAFNLPLYFPNASQLEEAISSIEKLSIEKMEDIHFPRDTLSPEDAGRHTRAGFESILRGHFKTELDMDQLFERHLQKLHEFSEQPRFTTMEELDYLFVLVKCSANDKN